YFTDLPEFMHVLSILYTFFFAFIFIEVLRYLVKPSYINRDIIVAAGCGYLLLLEISSFVMEYLYYHNPDDFIGIRSDSAATVFMDIVYFSSSTLTTIGFGDITPVGHHVRLICSLIGIVGQFYLVVLMGIIISKFSNLPHQPKKNQE
ncbi:MAG: potassium channel family protein, partial [Bacteroidota bacterium]|nr:potassium channel family protein [Bacteroidota bacterium]MDX5430189.1 potassium channel family protein [Bacteroidota bacterium]MDX5468952.1 potassium channel family protein [Bacteroidota bacterium]